MANGKAYVVVVDAEGADELLTRMAAEIREGHTQGYVDHDHYWIEVNRPAAETLTRRPQ